MPEAVVFTLKGHEEIWWAIDDTDGLSLDFGRSYAGPGSIVIPGNVNGVETLSRNHFRVSRIRSTYWVEDLGSENLTSLLHRHLDGRVTERTVFSATETTLPCEVRAGDVTIAIHRETLPQKVLDQSSNYVRTGTENLLTTAHGASISPYGRTEMRWAAAVNEISTIVRREFEPGRRTAEAAETLRKYFRAAGAAILLGIDPSSIASALGKHGIGGWTNPLTTRVLDWLRQSRPPVAPLRLEAGDRNVVFWILSSSAAPNDISLAAVDFAENSTTAATFEKADRLVEITLKFLSMFAGAEKEIATSHETVQGLTHVQLSETIKSCCHDTGFCYESQASRELLRVVELVGARLFQGDRLPLPVVLLQGERGVGKTKLVSVLRAMSGRSKGPIIEQNCAGIPRELAESILFGHKKGAFTHATADRPGLFQAACDGILFLDEIGDLPIDLQPKLLTVLETGRYRPIGETSERSTNCYIVTASNKDLQQLCRDGAFREDLYDRIATVRIEIPPLRERREDIPHLLSLFMNTTQHDTPLDSRRRLSQKLVELVSAAPWPGNTRQLRSVVENIRVFSPQDKQVVDIDDLPDLVQAELRTAIGITATNSETALANAFDLSRDLRWNVARFEREYLIRLFVLNKGTKSKTITAANMNHNVFYDRIRKWRTWIEEANAGDRDEIAYLRNLAGKYWDRLWNTGDDSGSLG